MIEDIKFEDEESIFLVRVAGVNNHNNKVLLHKKVGDPFWNMIGGKPKIGETTIEGLKREYFEETSLEIDIKYLKAIVENVFSKDEKRVHELLFIYEIDFDRKKVLKNIERGLVLQWFSKKELSEEKVIPGVIKELFFEDNLKGEIKHIINIE